MQIKIQKILEEVTQLNVKNKQELEEFRVKFLGKKGYINDLFSEFKNVPSEKRKEIGQKINNLKIEVQKKINLLKDSFENNEEELEIKKDLTLPVDFENLGARHPLSIVYNEIVNIFSRIGFNVSEGPEIEDEWHNFSALNFPEEHPARDMQDTFFIENNPNDIKNQVALRTHTSCVQARVMESSKPPIRTISPGRVFRNEAISARAHCIFHQVEGLYIDKNVSFADLKQTLLYFAKEMFGESTKIRFRPSYFPFTEPSAELDVTCNICGGKGCNVCKYTGWLEILGCGMVDPNVLKNCGIDNEKYTGFAFGMGIERIAMLKYQINDLRLFFENDMGFLKQFESAI
ncbi:MAG: phenylalanine--tRNA ligase subunit alpha [Bacteroidales bacterium]|nr:phenylalanine--tRNA ligase subunit alpha [Bacteroidales bacterium]